jgi:hypothetical protein
VTKRRKGDAVVLRELSAADLGDGQLLGLIRSRDPVGVLSIYVDGAATATYRGAAIDIDNRLAGLERSVTADGSPLVAEALSDTLRRIAPVVERLLDPSTSGRGRVLFASLSSRELTLVSSAIRVNNRVVLESTPFIHPLLELIDEGRPAGVLLISARSADLLDWRLGYLRRVSHVRVGPALPYGERSGAIVASASRAQQSAPTRERDARRERDTHRRFVDQVAREAARLAGARDWERVLIAGDRRLTRPLTDALPNWLSQNAVLDSRHLTHVDGPVLAIAVADRLASERAERHLALARRIRDAALGGGSGALGLTEVLAALNDARVEHLIYDPEIDYTGALGEDDLPLASSDSDGIAVKESRLTERIVERSLLTAARITPLDAAAAETLADAGGIAALLRW